MWRDYHANLSSKYRARHRRAEMGWRSLNPATPSACSQTVRMAFLWEPSGPTPAYWPADRQLTNSLSAVLGLLLLKSPRNWYWILFWYPHRTQVSCSIPINTAHKNVGYGLILCQGGLYMCLRQAEGMRQTVISLEWDKTKNSFPVYTESFWNQTSGPVFFLRPELSPKPRSFSHTRTPKE